MRPVIRETHSSYPVHRDFLWGSALPADLDIGLLRAVLAVAETGGFTAAARRLNRTQSAVSMQVRRLEEILGAPVFVRSATGAVPTARGESLLGHARRIVAAHDAAVAELSGGAVTGAARIGVMDDYATHVLPPLFAAFTRLHPGIALEVTTGFTAALVGRLGSDFDLVLATQPAGSRRGRVLRTERVGWAFAARLPLPAGEVLPLALLAPGNLFRAWAVDALDRAGRPWRVLYSSGSISAVEAAAAAGIAVTVVKAGTARPDLRILGPAEGLPPLPVAEIALHRAPGRLPPAAQALAEFLERELAQP